MKKIILLTILMLVTLTIIIVELKTEFSDAFEPQISQSSNYNGVLV